MLGPRTILLTWTNLLVEECESFEEKKKIALFKSNASAITFFTVKIYVPTLTQSAIGGLPYAHASLTLSFLYFPFNRNHTSCMFACMQVNHAMPIHGPGLEALQETY